MSDYTTDFGSIEDYTTGGVMAIDDDPKNYVFSNVFDVAAKSAPYERVAVGKNFEYVIETIRAEGPAIGTPVHMTSSFWPWTIKSRLS